MLPLHLFRKSLVLLALVGFACLSSPAMADPAAQVTATLNYVSGMPGSEIYRYDYTVHNINVIPEIHAFLIFFDSDPSTGAFDGSDDLDYVSATGANADWEPYVAEYGDPDSWYVEFDNYVSSGPVPGQNVGTFSVQVLWKDANSVPPSAQFFEVFNGAAHEGATTTEIITTAPRNGSIQGNVTGCTGTPLAGVTVDLYNTVTEALVASTLTNSLGNYLFSNIPPGIYSVNVITPLGYTIDGEFPNQVSVGGSLNFALDCQTSEYDPRTIGFWKHQPNVYLTGQGKAQVTKTQLIAYLDGIYNHFALSPVHPVSVYTVPPSATALTKLNTAQDILTVSGGASMNLRARQQLMALLLNVTSLKIGMSRVCSVDGATVTQAITYAWDLIADANAANDEIAKTIADEINNGRLVGAGIIPPSTPVILYSEPGTVEPPVTEVASGFGLGQNFPNPFKPATRIPFVVPAGAGQATVSVGIFDLNGRLVNKLVDATMDAGNHEVVWDGTDMSGQSVSAGVYFYRMSAGSYSETRKLQVLR